jgi:hypothetical protein
MLRYVALARTNISKEHQFSQQPHGITFQKAAFYNLSSWHLKLGAESGIRRVVFEIKARMICYVQK